MVPSTPKPCAQAGEYHLRTNGGHKETGNADQRPQNARPRQQRAKVCGCKHHRKVDGHPGHDRKRNRQRGARDGGGAIMGMPTGDALISPRYSESVSLKNVPSLSAWKPIRNIPTPPATCML